MQGKPVPIKRPPDKGDGSMSSRLPLKELCTGVTWWRGKRFLIEGKAAVVVPDLRKWGAEISLTLNEETQWWVTDHVNRPPKPAASSVADATKAALVIDLLQPLRNC